MIPERFAGLAILVIVVQLEHPAFRVEVVADFLVVDIVPPVLPVELSAEELKESKSHQVLVSVLAYVYKQSFAGEVLVDPLEANDAEPVAVAIL